jgi:pectate lyase
MKKLFTVLLTTIWAVSAFAQVPDFSLVGFGAATTGGTGGSEVTVTNLAELTSALATAGKLIIKIDGTITASGTILEVTSDKTIIGVADRAFLQGIGFHLKNVSNIIIRNIKFTMIGGGADDIIGAETTSSNTAGNYWIDHCEFYNEYPTLPETAAKKDKYDGLIDVKQQVSNITISWCYFHDHWKCSLTGFSTDKDPYDRKITYHHNWFKNIRSRVPSYRAGTGHVYNNFYDGLNDPNSPTSDGVHSRDGACLYVEGNYFQHYAKSVYWDVNDSPTESYVNESGATNMYVSPTPANTAPACNSFVPPYTVHVDSAANVPALVTAWAGIGKLDATTTYTLTTNVSGTGGASGTINPSSGTYPEGTKVQVTATPDAASTFATWSGDVVDTAKTITLTMNGNKTITANFVPYVANKILTVATVGNGSVTLSPTGGSYTPGTEVTLTAVAASDASFSGWSGAVTGTDLTAKITMDADKSVTATFVGGGTKKKIAYVTDATETTYPNDTKILATLKADPNLEITEVSSATSGHDYSGYDMVLFSEIPNSVDPGVAELKGVSKPFLMMKVHSYKTASGAWNWTSTTSAYGQNASATNITVLDKTHPIFKDVTWVNTNEVQMLSAVASSKGLTYMNPASFTSVSGGTITSLANVKDQTAQINILEIPAGTTVAGTLVPKKFIQIGINGSSYANVTTDAVSIVKNACYYLLDMLTEVKPESSSPKTVKTNFVLAQNFPNPFNPATTINYQLKNDSKVTLKVYNIFGQEVASLVNANEKAGSHSVSFDASKLPSGVYLYCLQAGNYSETKKMTLLK